MNFKKAVDIKSTAFLYKKVKLNSKNRQYSVFIHLLIKIIYNCII